MKTRNNGIFILLLGMLMVLVSCSTWVWAESKVGLDLQAGTDVILTDGWQGDDWYNSVKRISVRYETNSILKWENLWLGAEGVYSKHKADSKIRLGFDTGFVDWGLLFTAKWQLWDDLLYVGGLAGMSYWFDRDHGGHFGDSHFLGTFGAMIGKDWKIFETPWSIRTEARLSHTSDPFRTNDRGANHCQVIIGLSYTFKNLLY